MAPYPARRCPKVVYLRQYLYLRDPTRSVAVSREENNDEGTQHAELIVLAHTRRYRCGRDSRTRRMWLFGEVESDNDTRNRSRHDSGATRDDAEDRCSGDSSAANGSRPPRSTHYRASPDTSSRRDTRSELSERDLRQLVGQHGL